MNISSRLKRSGPPQRQQAPATPAAQEDSTTEAAAPQEKDSKKWLKVAFGAGLAATALSACGTPTPPAADPGAYEIESPDLVVLSDSIQRVDLARETRTECTGTGESQSCHTENVAYHTLGIHVGEGVVQDFNGNLFAAPQLAADGAPGIAVSNPTKVEVDGPLRSNGTLKQVDQNTYETRGSLFGKKEITVAENEIDVETDGFLGASDITRVTNSDGVSTVREGRHKVALVQSQGDHILVQTEHGRTIAEIRHEDNQYEVHKPGAFGGSETTMTYSDSEITRKNGRWNGNTVVRDNNSKGQVEFKEKSGRHTVVTTTVTEDGWIDDPSGLLSGKYTFEVEGGSYLPG